MKLDYLSPYYWYMTQKNNSKKMKEKLYSVPIVSVGNINTGGSGKTPFISFLVKEIKAFYPQKRILIVSKSYKASLKNPQEVKTENVNQPSIFGDESCLLKLMTHVDVWSGPTKYKTLDTALNQNHYDIVIVDDGFSHRQIKPDLNIVLFDVSRDPSHYRIIPFGFMREPWEALKRSDVVILTKIENQKMSITEKYKSIISKYQKNILSLKFLTKLTTNTKKIFFVTGIGNPKALKDILINQGFQIIKEKIYPDHYEFPESEQIKIWNDYQSYKAAEITLVTTAKDRIKITNKDLLENILTIDLDVSMEKDSLKVVHEKINQLF